MNPVAVPYDEQATLNELVFALGGRDEPTVALVECASLAKRRELEAEMALRLPEYQFFPLDVTPYVVTSLLGTLAEYLPDEVQNSQAVSWVVNVHGLENSCLLGPDGQLVPSPLTAQLNLERELLFRRVPYLIVLWGDADFFRTLQREAPDFWHWVTYRFRFEDHEARTVAELPPLPPERLPGRGNVAERQVRITELKERYEHLAFDDSDKKRLIKDKIDILTLLGSEYLESFEYSEAVVAYKTAIALQERLRIDDVMQGELWFDLGRVYLANNQFLESINCYERCKELANESNMPGIFHQVGRIYQAQQKWTLALENYQQSLQWQQKLGIDSNKGNSYHQIGMVYESQQEWVQALDNYNQALKWKRLAGDESGMGSTYHQIGMTYQFQKEWALALDNYQKAIRWKLRTGNEYGTGITNQLIGRVYALQQQYDKAIIWLRRSIKILSKYGHPLLPEAKTFLTQTLQLRETVKNEVVNRKNTKKDKRKKKRRQ